MIIPKSIFLFILIFCSCSTEAGKSRDFGESSAAEKIELSDPNGTIQINNPNHFVFNMTNGVYGKIADAYLQQHPNRVRLSVSFALGLGYKDQNEIAANSFEKNPISLREVASRVDRVIISPKNERITVFTHRDSYSGERDFAFIPVKGGYIEFLLEARDFTWKSKASNHQYRHLYDDMIRSANYTLK